MHLQLQQKAQNRAIELFLEDEHILTVDRIFLKSELASWDVASKGEFFDRFYPLEERFALRVALLALSRKAMHSEQLKQLLEDRFFSHGAIAFALGEIGRFGYLQDEDFERSFVQKLQKQGKSRHEIAYKAKSKGIPLQNLPFGSEEEALKTLIEKRYSVLLQKGVPHALKQKAVRALSRKGFPISCILKYFIV